jgi:hypothetical protein
MRLRVILIGVGLLVFIFCAFGSSHAALDNKYYIRITSSPDEHPWQHDDTPIVKDGLNRDNTSNGILPLYPLIKTIISIQIPDAPGSPERAKPKTTVFQGDEQHSNGPR